jgi:hypothetical protein
LADEQPAVQVAGVYDMQLNLISRQQWGGQGWRVVFQSNFVLPVGQQRWWWWWWWQRRAVSFCLVSVAFN